MLISEQQLTKPQTDTRILKNNEKSQSLCLALLLTRWLATHRIVSSVPQEAHHPEKVDISFYRSLPVVQQHRFANLLTLRLTQHTVTVEIVFPVARPGRARCWMRHVLTWPRRSHVIWLQGTRFWCNYTSVGLLMPWKIFTQVSHNHSGTAVDGELHTARHTPAVDCIIFLQRCSGDTSVCHLWLISLWTLDKGKPRSSASWKVSVSSL